jgi:hypothetical protein
MTGALGARVQLGVLKVIVWLYSSLAAAACPSALIASYFER